MLTPEEIIARDFRVAPSGYDRQEVAEFLREVAIQQDRLRRRVRQLERSADDLRESRSVSSDGGSADQAGGPVPAEHPTADALPAQADARARVEGVREPSPARDAPRRPAARDGDGDGATAAGQAVRGVAAVGGPRAGAGWSASPIDDVAPADAVRVIERGGGSGRGARSAALDPQRLAHDSSRPRPVRMRAATLAAVGPEMVEALRDVLPSLWERLLEASAETDGERPAVVDVEILGEVAQPHLTGVYEAGLDDGARLSGAEVDGFADPMRVEVVARAFGVAVSHALQVAADASLRSAGASPGDDAAATADGRHVEQVLEEVTGRSVATLVDGHLVRTYSYGVYDAWCQLGVGARNWIDVDEADCPESRCRMNALQGAVALSNGFPSGDLVPPAHDGCVCAVEPV